MATNQTMANDARQAVSDFLKTQVWRTDFHVLDEQMQGRTRFAHEQKLEQLHALCLRVGYRSPTEAERIRRQLYSGDHESGCPAALLLSLAYLPECVHCDDDPRCARPCSQESELRTPRLRQTHAPQDTSIVTLIDWQKRRYQLALPPSVHTILIRRDTGLMAA